MLEISKAILGLDAASGVLLTTGLDCLLAVSHWIMVGAEEGPLKSSTAGVVTDMGESNSEESAALFSL